MFNIVKKYLDKLGWQSEKKLLVFCSDDWGGIRNCSLNSHRKLSELGLIMNSNRFDRFDTLESNKDMETLFEVLLKYRDHRGNHPVITAVTNVGNPDFDKIKKDNYEKYYWEPFTETLSKHPNRDKVYDYYLEGIARKIFIPESHGREHLQILWWMEELRQPDSWARKAFTQKFFFLGKDYLKNKNHNSLGAAFDVQTNEDVASHSNTIKESLSLFRELFGYSATYFTPPALRFQPSLEPVLSANKIKLLDVSRLQQVPFFFKTKRYRFNYLGKKSTDRKMRYLTRNSVFEPNLYDHNSVDVCLAGVEKAFKNKQPAIMSNHRAAFVGGINIKNRDQGLMALDNLFSKVLEKWPDVQFISSQELINLMCK